MLKLRCPHNAFRGMYTIESGKAWMLGHWKREILEGGIGNLTLSSLIFRSQERRSLTPILIPSQGALLHLAIDSVKPEAASQSEPFLFISLSVS